MIEIIELTDPRDIQEVLNATLQVPNAGLKLKIVERLTDYLKEKIAKKDNKIKVFAAFFGSEPRGFVTCQISPDYTSYGRKCATFGWLSAKDFDTCKILTKKCEDFARANKSRRLRGPINFPKALGGVGYQTEGFDQRLLYGVAFSDPFSHALNYLNKLGYEIESEYSCLKVSQQMWKKGAFVDKSVKFKFIQPEEFANMREKMLELARNSFQLLLPDTSGGEERLDELSEIYSEASGNCYTRCDVDLRSLSDVPAFAEMLNMCDLEKILNMMLLAFDRNSEELIGILIGIPDLYQHWLGKPITRVNVDTAMVKKGFDGKGVFSALNNFGQLTLTAFGIDYFEGTGIWTGNSKGVNNENAIKTIFPHCELIRKHIVVEKKW